MTPEAERKLGWRVLAMLGALPLVLLPGAAFAAGRVQPAAGTYEGTVDGTSPHNRGAGCFEQKPTVFGKRVKPADHHGSRCRDQIIAPSLGPVPGVKKGCDRSPAVLDTGGFPIQQARFHYKGAARIGPHHRRLTVNFKGRWITRTEAVGTTQISGGGCNSSVSWKMATPPS